MFRKPKKNEKYKVQKHLEHIKLHIIDDKAQSSTSDTKRPRVPIFQDSVRTDPLGSYTGKPADPDDVPVQDVDDL